MESLQEIVVSAARGIAAVLTLLVIWFAIQAFIRRRSGCGRDHDVLDHLKHGCAGCKGDGACRRKKETHPETNAVQGRVAQ
jgi:hypothetical protein